MSKFRWIFAAVGAVLGIAIATFVHNAQAQIQPLRAQIQAPRVVIKTCNVAPTFGALKGTTTAPSWSRAASGLA